MAHGHRAGHDHHAHQLSGRRLRTAMLLTSLVLVAEVAGGLISGSLAVLADAGHVLTDMLALGLAWFAAEQAGRPANASNTFGYHRTGILAALANAVTLLAIVLVIAVEAVHRFQTPQHVQPPLMIAAAAVAIVVNLAIVLSLSDGDSQNLNERAALLHVLGDVGASAGVIVGALIIAGTGWTAVDPVISLAIALLIARGAWVILGETIAILMEAAPREMSAASVARDMMDVPTVSGVHDLHLWSIAGGMHALSAHVEVQQDCYLSNCDTLLAGLNRILADRYSIGHTTIQFEYTTCERHETGDLYCSMDHLCHCGDQQLPDSAEPQRVLESARQ
jgi:cobalt-zinc-cadmium efflux system protein